MCEHEYRANSLEQIDALAQIIYERLLSASSESSRAEAFQYFIDGIREILDTEKDSPDLVCRALAKLSREHIELLQLSAQGLDYTEVARRLQRPPEEVLRDISRARAALRFSRFPDL